MADGTQKGFGFPDIPPTRLRPGEIVVDLFAGGGGASVALEAALRRQVDIAINHDEFAVGMHAANHPLTRHLREDVWVADPLELAAGRAVGWLHASPDCTHFSQARGGQPRSRKVRALSWVVVKWVGRLHAAGLAPRYISLENVEQILTWGPLVAKRDKATGRVLKMDGSVAARGERVPVELQQLVPDKRHAGRTWDQFVAILRGFGYQVEWKKVVAADHGAGTSRKRLFLVARNDHLPIVWPEPTHGPGRAQPYVTAGDCIDWSIPCPSIFARKKPLADATHRRIARGIKRFVLDAAEPFIVPATHHGSDRCNAASDPMPTVTGANRGELMAVQPILAPIITEHANASREAAWSPDEPLRTQCAQVKGGHFALGAATLVGVGGRAGESEPRSAGQPGYTTTGKADCAVALATLVQTGYGERPGQEPRVPGLGKPLGTVVDGQKHAAVAAHLVKFRHASDGSDAGAPMPTITSGAGAARPAGAAHALGVVTAFMEQANGGYYEGAGVDLRSPQPTICAEGSHQRLVAVHLQHASTSNTNGGRGRVDLPLRTVLAGGQHHAVVECTLSPEHEAGALRVAAFLVKYYGTALGVSLADPLDTVTTRDRLALVTVYLKGVPYVIVDIGLRMLKPHELYLAQGFPPHYIIDRTADGRRLNVSQQVRMVGNSVSPPPLFAIVDANLPAAVPVKAAA